jgi:hypothetical protein
MRNDESCFLIIELIVPSMIESIYGRNGMKKLSILTVLLLLGAAGMQALFAGGSQERAAEVDTENRQVILDQGWEFSWDFTEQEIEFTLTAPTTGWLAIGFNPSRMMKDADYVIGYVSDGEAYIRDDYGQGLTSHVSDDQLGGSQDIRLISGSESGGSTTLVFALPRSAQDQYDEHFTPGEQYDIILAFAGSGGDNFTSKHTRRTSVEVEL